MKPRTIVITPTFFIVAMSASPVLASSDVGVLDKVQSAFGDFDGDGALDLAVGDPTDATNAGAVDIIYDFDNDNTTVDETWTRSNSGILEAAQAGDYFGSAVAVGDFDGDGHDDIAIGVPGDESVTGATDVGSVSIIYGSSSGLTSTGNQFWNQDSSGILDSTESYDYFGEFLAAGDFDCDGYDDLAIGVPQEDLGAVSGAGAVHILYGSSSGLASTGNQQWTQDSSGIEDTAETDDNFAGALAAGNFDGDTAGGHACEDLAIGVPGETVGSTSLAGAVNVIYATTSGLSSTDDQLWHQDVTGIVDSTDLRDVFGARLATSDLDADGYDDLEVLAPDEATCSSSEDGIHTVYGGTSGLSAADDYLYCGPDDEPQALTCGWVTVGPENWCKCSCKIGELGCVAWAAANSFVGADCDRDGWEITCTAPTACD